jgi:hypothetical protein
MTPLPNTSGSGWSNTLYSEFEQWCWRVAGRPGFCWDGQQWTTEKPNPPGGGG